MMMVLRHQVTLFPDITTKCTDHNNDEYFIYTDHYGYISSKTNAKRKQIKKGISKDGKKNLKWLRLTPNHCLPEQSTNLFNDLAHLLISAKILKPSLQHIQGFRPKAKRKLIKKGIKKDGKKFEMVRLALNHCFPKTEY